MGFRHIPIGKEKMNTQDYNQIAIELSAELNGQALFCEWNNVPGVEFSQTYRQPIFIPISDFTTKAAIKEEMLTYGFIKERK